MNEVINYMKTNNIEQFKKNFNKMQEGGNKSSFNLWTSCVKTRLPKDFSITKSEIMSEVVNQCMYLSDKFDEKKCPDYVAYCNKYVVLLATKEIMKVYNKMKNNKQFTNDYDEDFSDYFVAKNNLCDGTVDVNDIPYQPQRNVRKDAIEKWLKVYEAAMKLDAETEHYYEFANMIDDLKMGISMEEIAKEKGVSKMTISKRLQMVKDEVKRMEKESEN